MLSSFCAKTSLTVWTWTGVKYSSLHNKLTTLFNVTFLHKFAEYPAYRDGGKPKDRENYAKLVQELREEFQREHDKTGRPRLLLTMAVPAGFEYIEKGYDVPKLNKYLDWFNLLSYDYHSAYEPSVNHHAPLYPIEEENEYSYDTDLNIVRRLFLLYLFVRFMRFYLTELND